MSKNYLTRTGYERLEKEYNTLLNVERPATVQVVSWAASNGDRSENGDYIYGKKRLREIDKRILFLTRLLSTAIVIDIHTQDHSQIFFGATVIIESIDQEEQPAQKMQFTIVGEQEADPQQGKINFRSPLGQSLIGKDKGDIITLSLSNTQKEMIISDFFYTSL